MWAPHLILLLPTPWSVLGLAGLEGGRPIFSTAKLKPSGALTLGLGESLQQSGAAACHLGLQFGLGGQAATVPRDQSRDPKQQEDQENRQEGKERRGRPRRPRSERDRPAV